MSYAIVANGKSYTVEFHAIERMKRRGISEEMVIAVLEGEPPYRQRYGTDVYEDEAYYSETDEWITVRVVVDEKEKRIVTVMEVER